METNDTIELRDNCSTLNADDGQQNQPGETELVTDTPTDDDETVDQCFFNLFVAAVP